MAILHFKIVTPERVVYDSEVEQVSIPTTSGEITILPNHIPLVSTLQAGELRLKKDSNEVRMAVSGGFLEVQPKSTVMILADTAERAEDIDIERAEAARKRAQELLEKKQFESDVQAAALQAALERSLTRLRVARRRRLGQ